jgi:hypothetical protein
VDDATAPAGEAPEPQVEERRLASGIYGLVVSSATLAAASASGRVVFVAISTFVTVFVYWASESYAHSLARHAVKQTPLTWAELRVVLAEGWPMVSASYLPMAALLLSKALGASVFAAINLALAVATILMLFLGYRASHLSGLRGWRLAASTVISGLFGLTMVGLKNLLH